MSNRSQALAFASAFACLLCATAAGAVECEFFDVDADSLADKACKVDYGNGSEVISMAGRRIVFVEKGRQGQWAFGTLDGKPAARYEINRETYSYATQDLKQFLDVRPSGE